MEIEFEDWQLSEWGRARKEKELKESKTDPRMFDLIKKSKCNDNHVNPVREEIFALDKKIQKTLGEKLLGHYKCPDTGHKFKKPNLWNMNPQKLRNWHWFMKFELSWRTKAKEHDKAAMKKKMKVLKGGEPNVQS